jgi:hypothetical protein
MASQGTVKKAVGASKPNKTSEKKARVFDYLRFKLAIQDQDDFQAYLHGYPDKTGLMAYVYRLVPRIDVRLVGISETNILETATLSEMTAGFIEHKFGQGKYMLKLNDANRAKGENEVCRTWFKLEDSEKAPVYDIRTLLLGHPDNQDEVNRLLTLGQLVREPSGAPRLRNEGDGSPVGHHASLPSGGGGGSELLTKETVGQLILKLVDRGSQSPGDAIRQSIEIAKLLAPPASAAAAPLDVAVIAELVAARMAQAGGSRRGGSADIFENYERLEGFIQKVRGGGSAVAIPGDGAAAGGGWVAAVPGILAGLAGVIPLIIAGVTQLRAGPAGMLPGLPAAPTPVAPGPGPRATVQQIKPLPDRILDIATLGMSKMGEGVSGFDFAAWVCAWYPGGLEVYQFLEPQGAAGVVGLMAMNPGTAAILQDDARRGQIEAFLSDFFTYDPAGGADDGAAVPSAVPSA